MYFSVDTLYTYLSDNWSEVINVLPILPGNFTSEFVIVDVSDANSFREGASGVIFTPPAGLGRNKNHNHNWNAPPQSETQVKKYVEDDLVASKAANLLENLVRGQCHCLKGKRNFVRNGYLFINIPKRN